MPTEPLTNEELANMNGRGLSWPEQARLIAQAREANALRGDPLCHLHGGRTEVGEDCLECQRNAASNYQAAFEDVQADANSMLVLVEELVARKATREKLTCRDCTNYGQSWCPRTLVKYVTTTDWEVVGMPAREAFACDYWEKSDDEH